MKTNLFKTPFTRTLSRVAPAALALLLCVPGTGSASEIFNLDYWLANAPTGAASDWVAKSGSNRESHSDDNGTGSGGYVGPGFGGQLYDAEAIYVELIGSVLNIAVVTGMPQGHEDWAPGDIAIDLDYQSGNPSFDIGIVTTSFEHGSMQVGEAYQVDNTETGWDYGIWKDGGSHQGGTTYNPHQSDFVRNEHPTIMNNGSLLTNGVTSFYYGAAKYGDTNYADAGNSLGIPDKQNGGNDLHYLIAASLDLGSLPIDLPTKGNILVHWTMRCANDYIQVDPAQVPEPAPILLLFGGLLGLAGVRRLRKT